MLSSISLTSLRTLPQRLLAAALLLACAACHTTPHIVLTASVAASLTEAIQAVEAAYTRDHPGVEIRNNFGGSGALAQQIELGAPVDIFLSAAAGPMDELQSQSLIVRGSRRDLVRNTLVLIAPRGSPLHDFQQLSTAPVRSIAIGDPGSVPAGKYAQQTLTAMHLLAALHTKIVLAENVRQVLAFVETGNADAGLVYATDAAASSKVRIVATAPESSHDPIVYPAAAIRTGSNQAAAEAFVDYLASPTARAIFTQRGFTMAAQ